MNYQRFFQILILLSLSAIIFGCPPAHQGKPPPVVDITPIPVDLPSQPANLQPILRLDTGGHTGLIGDLIVTSDKKHIISCSDDKTIRMWDMQTKKEVRKVLEEIGKEPFGQIFAIALSPDDRFLAVGGWLDDKNDPIRIYHFPTGELVRILKSHNNVVYNLSFSPDGQYLVSGSGDYTVKVWDAADEFKLVHTFKAHTDPVNAVRIFPHQGDYRVVSAAYDHKVILYSLNRKEVLASFSHDDRLYSLTASHKYIVWSGDNDNKINIFDLNLTHIKTIESETIPTGLAFSPNGKLLLAGTGSHPLNCNIYDTEQNFKKIRSFQKHDNLVMAVAFADNATAVTGGGDNKDIRFWNPRTGETKGHIIGGGERVWSVGIKGDEIAFGNIPLKKSQYNTGKLEKGFSPSQSKDFSEFNRVSTRFWEIQAALARIGNIDEILKSGLPPVLEMVNTPAGQLTNRNLKLNLKLTDRGGGIGRIVFRVNGVEYGTPQGARPMDIIGSRSSSAIYVKKFLTLKNGPNTITVTAYNKDGKIESKPVGLIVSVDDPRGYEPDLYGLCIGITRYRDYSLNLKYAANDALSIKDELETRAGPLFKNVYIKALTDEQASTDGIRVAFKEISSKIRTSDVFVLYMSGHGKTLDSQYHFIPWEMRYENEASIRKQSLSNDNIQKLIAMIRAQKSLIILDTCYSGSLSLPSSKGMEEKTAIDRLMRATGRATLAATSDTALAYEGHNGHGIFTHAILEGLRANADRKGNRDGAIGIDELANFVQDEVPRITFDKFGFEQIPMRSVIGNTFPIGCSEGYNRPGCRP